MSFFEETQIMGGPLVVTHAMPQTQMVSLGLFVDIGSRDESSSQAGIAHALEHMLFKGTAELDAITLNERLDLLGGTANAFTSRERTCIHIHVLREDWREALGLLVDMVLYPALPEEEWEKEREVIFSEMGMVEDMPDDWAMDQHMQALYPDDALGRSVLGERESLLSSSRDTLVTFLRSHYRPPKLMVVAAGGIEHEALVDYVQSITWPRAESARTSRQNVHPVSGVQLLPRESGQAHLIISYPGIPAASDERPTAWLANQLLGGGMSSRLFREVREKRGLAYHVGSHLFTLSNLGLWTVTCDVDPERLSKSIEVIGEVLDTFADSITEKELERAKRQLQIQMRMGMDSVEGMMVYLGGRFDEQTLHSPDDWAEAVRNVSISELQKWIQVHLVQQALWTLSGPQAEVHSAAELLHVINKH